MESEVKCDQKLKCIEKTRGTEHYFTLLENEGAASCRKLLTFTQLEFP